MVLMQGGMGWTCQGTKIPNATWYGKKKKGKNKITLKKKKKALKTYFQVLDGGLSVAAR